MRQALSISELAKSAGVTSKTLRHWERLGLLPKAARTHTGYRVFDPQTAHYIDFVQKSKTVGLTLKETKRLLELARKGKNPCPQVVNWVDKKCGGRAADSDSQGVTEAHKRVPAYLLNIVRHDLLSSGRDVLPYRRFAES